MEWLLFIKKTEPWMMRNTIKELQRVFTDIPLICDEKNSWHEAWSKAMGLALKFEGLRAHAAPFSPSENAFIRTARQSIDKNIKGEVNIFKFI